MAIVEKFIASVEVGDSAKHLRSASIRVSPANARLYIAAANQAARDATDVGLLLIAALNMTAAEGTNHYKKWSVQSDFINDAYLPQSNEDQIYNSNRWKVTYQTTVGGLPVVESIYIPQRRDPVDMESDGVSANLADGAEIEAFVDALIADGLGSGGAAITAVLSITANDE